MQRLQTLHYVSYLYLNGVLSVDSESPESPGMAVWREFLPHLTDLTEAVNNLNYVSLAQHKDSTSYSLCDYTYTSHKTVQTKLL